MKAIRYPASVLVGSALLALICSCGSSSSTGLSTDGDADGFVLTSPALADGGTLPIAYTCDGDGISPPLGWIGAPYGTACFALTMHHEAGPGDVHSYWVLYDIPADVSALESGVSDVGSCGMNGVDGRTQYAPPCSQGPGEKSYTITLYALSAPSDLPDPGQVDRDALLAAIAGVTLAATDITVRYERGQAGGPPGRMTLEQTLSDGAQRSTLAFAGLGMVTGNIEAQSFFPPGKVADYWGFQYMRDNDPDGMGHNTSFLTRIANNVLYILDDAQLAELVSLARAQVPKINEYAYERYPLMMAFRRLMEGDVPAGATGLSRDAVVAASADLYELDGQISYDRAILFAELLRGLDGQQADYLESMKGKGWASWPDIDDAQVRDRLRGLSHDESVAVMTYASDLFSWYAGSLEADVYFCPERQGTYFGSFYIKDAPAMGREGYSIDEQLTATAGAALCDSTKGYVTPAQEALVSSLVDTQRDNLHAGTTNIVQARTAISEALRSLISSTEPSEAFKDEVRATVLRESRTYGELDGENNFHYATVFAQLYASLSNDQVDRLMELRRSIMSGTYDDGTPFDFSVCTTPFLYSAVIDDASVLDPYVADTDYLFGP